MIAEVSGGGAGRPRKKPLGSPPPEVTDLARVQDRLTFAYFERCTVSRSDNAITIVDDEGTVYLPAASLNVLMLGPGTTVTHRAMTTIGENGATVIWVGERGVRMYAFGKPLTHSSALLQRQAALVPTRARGLPWRDACMACALRAKTYRSSPCSSFEGAKGPESARYIGRGHMRRVFRGIKGCLTRTITMRDRR